MKKIVYLCALVLLSLNVMAQIDLNDRNWSCTMIDDFNQPNRQFNNRFQEPLNKWIAYAMCLKSGVTKPVYLHNVYQYANNYFDSNNGFLRISAYRANQDSLKCGDYYIPPRKVCQQNHYQLYYLSGMIETPTPLFQYGYFEIRCKIPTHKGAFPGFWLYDSRDSTPSNPPYYEEIDIFEYSWDIADLNNYIGNPDPHGLPDYYTFTSGIYYNDNGTAQDSYARNFPSLDSNGPDLGAWHTFACEWMPDHVIWYCDSNIVNECYDTQHIPHHPLTLKATYAINNKYCYDNSTWMGPGYMYVDYINVYQLNWDCDTDETITCQLDLDNFDYGVKKSIDITSSVNETVVGSTNKVTLRATDSFEITGPFHTESGCEFTVIIQSCPNN